MIVSDFLKEQSGIRHGFFTREGGVSSGIYASLNCGFGSNDEAEHVRENRARVAAKLGTSREDLVTVRQVHSNRVVVAEASWRPETASEADAIVSRTPSLAIGVLTADCTPILFAEPEARVVGAAHAGWKGAKAGIIGAVVEAMEALGAQRDRICAAIGPTISRAAYEVGAEFEEGFLAENAANARYFTRAGPDERASFRPAGLLPGPDAADANCSCGRPGALHLSERITFLQLSPVDSSRRTRLWTPNFRHCYYVMWIRGFPGAFSRRFAVETCLGYSKVSGRIWRLKLRMTHRELCNMRNIPSDVGTRGNEN